MTGDFSHTFVFTDLVGYTALADLEGDERAADVAVEFAARVGSLLPEYRAALVKGLGDGLMLRCESAAEGIRLALRIVEEVAHDPRLPAVRAGVHTGTAVARNGDWYGRGVNVAARLCAAAAGDQVLVSEDAVNAAGSMRKVRVGERRLHWLKNVTEPVAALDVAAVTCGRGAHLIARLRPRRAAVLREAVQ